MYKLQKTLQSMSKIIQKHTVMLSCLFCTDPGHTSKSPQAKSVKEHITAT